MADTIKKVLKIAEESHHGLAQVYLALSELDKVDGRGNVGIDRLRGAAVYFEWCAEQIKALADRLEAEVSDGLRTDT